MLSAEGHRARANKAKVHLWQHVEGRRWTGGRNLCDQTRKQKPAVGLAWPPRHQGWQQSGENGKGQASAPGKRPSFQFLIRRSPIIRSALAFLKQLKNRMSTCLRQLGDAGDLLKKLGHRHPKASQNSKLRHRTLCQRARKVMIGRRVGPLQGCWFMIRKPKFISEKIRGIPVSSSSNVQSTCIQRPIGLKRQITGLINRHCGKLLGSWRPPAPPGKPLM